MIGENDLPRGKTNLRNESKKKVTDFFLLPPICVVRDERLGFCERENESEKEKGEKLVFPSSDFLH